MDILFWDYVTDMTSRDPRALGQEESKVILKKEKNRVACGGGQHCSTVVKLMGS